MSENECQRMVVLLAGLPQVRCGAPLPRETCPFQGTRWLDCPLAAHDEAVKQRP